MHDLVELARLTWAVLADLLPYFLLAIFIGACVSLLRLDILARRSFSKHGLLGIVFTTCLGAFSPFCSFTVIPLIRKLLRSGVPLSAVMAFWIASPAMSPGLFGITAGELGVPLAIARLVGAVLLAVGAGTFVLLLERRGMLRDVLRSERPKPVPREAALVPARQMAPVLVGGSETSTEASGGTAPIAVADREPPACGAGEPAPAAVVSSCASACSAGEDDNLPWWPTARAGLRAARTWRSVGRGAFRDGLSIGKWLLFACVFQAVIALYVPTHVVVSLLGGKGLFAIPMAVVISVPLYLNGASAIPIVGGLVMKGMASGAAISFLLGGSVTTIPAMAAVRGVVNNRAFVIYLGCGVIGSIALGFAAQLVLS